MRKLCESEIPSVHSYISKIISRVGSRALICKLQSKRNGGKNYFRLEELHDILCQEVEEKSLSNLWALGISYTIFKS
jgi:hypothetical protein